MEGGKKWPLLSPLYFVVMSLSARVGVVLAVAKDGDTVDAFTPT